MQDSETSELLNRIKSQFETDSSILLDYLLSFSKSLSEHYNQQYARLCEIKKELASLKPEIKKLKKDENEEKPHKNEEFKQEFPEEKSNQITEFPSEDSLLMNLITKFDEMSTFFKENGAKTESESHFSLIFNILWKLREFPENANFRQIVIDSKDFLLSGYLIEVFEILGFLRCEIDDKINLIYTNDQFPFFENAMQFIETEYYPNVRKSLINQLNIANSSERVQAQMNFNDKKREISGTYQENSITDQLKEYREKMKQKSFKNQGFSLRNIVTMGQFPTNQENLSKRSGFNNRIVTMSDIEKKRIEEDRVNFSKKALQLTNEFRKKQGKSPLEWNQNLCDIGMKHSKDMAEQKVPFGHQGFNQRAQNIAFQHGGVYENVAYCEGMQDTPKVIIIFIGVFSILS